MLVARNVYIIQENGQVILPKEFRQRYNLSKEDTVVLKETDEGGSSALDKMGNQ